MFDGLGLIFEYGEDRIEARDIEKLEDAFRRIENRHVSTLVSDGCPDGDELSQAGTVDVLHTREIQNKVAMPFVDQLIHAVAQRQIEYPQPAAQIDDHDFGNKTVLDDQRHTALILQRQSREH